MHATPGWSGGLGLQLAYIVINIDPVLVHLGPLAIHWYGLMYVVAISIGLWVSRRYAVSLGIHDEQVWSVFLGTAAAGLVGGRLYYVIQQPDLVQNFLLKPYNIIAVWDGGMAFFGAIFLGSVTLFYLARRQGFSPWIALDAAAIFAAVGQIFGRIGNIINGDIVGYAYTSGTVTVPGDTCINAPCVAYVPDPHIPWYATVYLNPGAFHPQSIPYQPAAAYEIGLNLVMLFIIWQVRYLLPRLRAGYLFALYLALYAVSQIIVFFARDNVYTPFLGINGLKQAQWTAIFVLIFAVPGLIALARRFSEPWRFSAVRPVPWPAGAKAIEAVGADAGDDDGEPLADLPPWQPVRAVGGQLRNLFGASRPSDTAQ